MKFNCECCKKEFQARAADRKRGWARFCSKSCKAKEQERRTGQYGRRNEEIRAANGGRSPRDFQREYGGIPVFNNQFEYEGFFAGPFDNTEHQNED